MMGRRGNKVRGEVQEKKEGRKRQETKEEWK